MVLPVNTGWLTLGAGAGAAAADAGLATTGLGALDWAVGLLPLAAGAEDFAGFVPDVPEGLAEAGGTLARA